VSPSLLTRCSVCSHRSVHPASACYECLHESDEQPDPTCTLCGGEANPGYATCWSCGYLTPAPAFAYNLNVLVRSDEVHNALLTYKYSARQQSRDLLARILEGYCAVHGRDLTQFDWIVPMPWHQNPGGGAQFDHMRDLVARVAPHVPDMPFAADLDVLQKTRPTGSQATDRRSREGRLKAYRDILDALEVPPLAPDVRGRRILIVDDVFTTGTTLNAAARRLKDRGATAVCGLTILRYT
jgi:predicted amidophosphoribosyltransferase